MVCSGLYGRDHLLNIVMTYKGLIISTINAGKNIADYTGPQTYPGTI